MKDGLETAESEPALPVNDNEPLLRLLWAEHDFRDGRIWPEAIPTSDLEKPNRGFSVDRQQLARRDIMEALVEHQRPRAKKPEDKQTPSLSLIASAKVVRELEDWNREKPFLVDASPTEATQDLPANPAHAEINSARKCPKSRLNERRQLLLGALGTLVEFANYWQSDASTARARSYKSDAFKLATRLCEVLARFRRR
jgi:hypothetical protein